MDSFGRKYCLVSFWLNIIKKPHFVEREETILYHFSNYRVLKKGMIHEATTWSFHESKTIIQIKN